MAKEDAFIDVYDEMSQSYSKLEDIMSDLYEYIRKNPTDEMTKDILVRLGNIGQNMLYTQKEFTKAYGDEGIKDSIIGNLDSKNQGLLKAKEDIKEKLM